jgi:O-antigen ligase
MRPALSLPRLPRQDAVLPALVALGGLGFAVLLGALVGRSPAMGVTLGAALVFVPIAFVDLPLALALWTGTLFLRLIPGVGLATSMAGLVIIAAWVGATIGRPAALRGALVRLRGVGVAAVALLVWLAITLAWAEDTSDAQSQLLYWGFAVLLLAIVATTLDTRARLRMVAGAFVAGASASVLVGLVTGDLLSGLDAGQSAGLEGRFTTAGADPNDLAAGLVPAAALAVGLSAGARGPKRLLLLVAALVCAGGVAATQSRGGLLAATLAIVAAIVVARGHRLQAIAAGLGVATIVAFLLATTPGALERITDTDNGGNGRTDLWMVAGRMVADRPLLGVGLDNFRAQSDEYVRQPGTLEYVDLIVENPHVVHNTYLQLLAETGAIGLGLYGLVVGLALAASWQAATRFRRRGHRDMEALAQATFVAQVGILASSVFLSIGNDFRAWLLIALGPALLALTHSDLTGAAPRRAER